MDVSPQLVVCCGYCSPLVSSVYHTPANLSKAPAPLLLRLPVGLPALDQLFASARVSKRENAHGQVTGVARPRVTDRDGGDRDAGRHLRHGEQGVEPAERTGR